MPAKTTRVDYLIIGAGMSGTVLRRFLRSDSVVLLDPNPESYKIGESIIPTHFSHPVLRALIPAVRKLPSYSQKWGTTFVTDAAVASFPLEPQAAEGAVHVAREELEALMRAEWKTPVVRERVTEVDLARKRVVTDRSVYQVEKQILDCSGPAMVVASAAQDIVPIRPVFSRWTYFDVTSLDDSRFWTSVLDGGRDYRRFEPASGRLLEGAETGGWAPSKTTILTAVSEGLWTWQIPMYKANVLSFGVVSRHGPVSDEQLHDLAERTHAAQYTLRRRRAVPGSALHATHRRDGFARRARVPATLDYVLVADACAFADPIYSVGTGLAVNKAIELAETLNDGGWTPAKRDKYCADYEALLKRAVSAFEYWYTGALLKDDAAAAEVQRDYLYGNAFAPGVAKHYGDAVNDSESREYDGDGLPKGAPRY